MWQNSLEPMAYGMVDTPYTGDLPLVEINNHLSQHTFADQQAILTEFVDLLLENGIVGVNPVTERILQNVDSIASVADMAAVSGMSARQLQRTLKRTTGFAPHDFLKVLRLQQALNGGDIWSYADQSHFIHSFRKATGYTPGKHSRKFDV